MATVLSKFRALLNLVNLLKPFNLEALGQGKAFASGTANVAAAISASEPSA